MEKALKSLPQIHKMEIYTSHSLSLDPWLHLSEIAIKSSTKREMGREDGEYGYRYEREILFKFILFLFL